MARKTSPQRAWDDYFIPGTFVLRNKFTGPGYPYGESDPARLQQLEEQFTSIRLAELRIDPLPGRFDYDHMKAIHHHIFQDVYEWAGQERTAPTDGPMTKEGHAYYPAGPALTAAAEAQYVKIAEANYLRGLDRGAIVTELAERWGELNVVHSFREGNTRAQFVFFFELCEQAGYCLDTEAFRPGNPLRDEFVQARFHSQDTGRNDQLAVVLNKAIAQAPPPPGRGSDSGPSNDPSLGQAPLRASFPQSPRTVRQADDASPQLLRRRPGRNNGPTTRRPQGRPHQQTAREINHEKTYIRTWHICGSHHVPRRLPEWQCGLRFEQRQLLGSRGDVGWRKQGLR
ncbi:MAG: Fic family protein [Actinomycetaceae bacterium]|nr:Fic family protein [Actinomycetaceae bacterium]